MQTTTEDPTGLAQHSSDKCHLSGVDRLSALAGLATLGLTVAVCIYMPASTPHFKRISDDPLYKQAFLRLDAILAGVFLSALLLTPAVQVAVARLRPKWRDTHTYCALIAICTFLWFFVLHFGRWQFGAFDFNILIEMGWRQIIGQRPYVDFPATTPPGFNLGAKYAFELFGVSWDANLYWTASFACATFLWMYWLMRRVSMGRLASAATAFAIECAAMLTLCFWWYNNSALISAAVFFLSCLAYAKEPRLPGVQLSYFASLVVLSLMKPNIAGLTIACSVPLLFLVTERKLRLIILTIGATLSALMVLALNHVPVAAMLSSYLSVAKERGSTRTRFGFMEMNDFEQRSALFWIRITSIPLLGLIPRAYKQIKAHDWRGIGLALLMPVSYLVALYGLLTNGEFRDAECTVLLAAGGVLTFGLRWNGSVLRRLAIAILCASIAGDLYYGANRLRVYGIGPHVFFEWHDNQHRVENGFFKNMKVSGSMVRVEKEVADAIKTNGGPYFFGTRVDFNYAVFGIHSPEAFPSWWHPGTAFPTSAQSKIIDKWKQDRFQTLIFMKGGFAGYGEGMFYTYYPQEFLNAIKDGYVADERYPDITVYHRRQSVR